MLRGVFALGALLLISASFPADSSAVPAQPYDVRVGALAGAARRAGERPEGLLALLEIGRNAAWATPTAAGKAYGAIAADPKVPAHRRSLAAYQLGLEDLRRGAVLEARERFRAAGYITDWRVVGPFDNEGKQGFDAEQAPERTRREPWDPAATFEGKDRAVGWRRAEPRSPRPYVNLGALLRPARNVCAFAEAQVRFEAAAPITVWLGAGGAVKAWWNGEPALTDAAYRGPFPDRAAAAVAARAGWNRLLVKVCAAEGPLGFFARLGDAQGGAPPVFTADASSTEALGAPANVAGGAGVRADLERLEEAARGASPRPEDLESLAKLLDYTGAEDPADRRTKDLAVAAAEARPTLERWLLAARLSTERGEKMRYADRAAALAPRDPRVQLVLARLRLGGPRPYDALALLDRVGPHGIAGSQAEVLRAEVLGALGLHEAALATLRGLRARLGDVPALLDVFARAAERVDRVDAALAAREALVAAQHDHVGARRALIEDGLRRGDTERVVAHLDVLRATDGATPAALLYLARVYRDLSKPEEAAQLYGAAGQLAPDDADVLLEEGRFLLRERRDEAARAVLRRAQALRPQDPAIRELLERMAPSVRPDEAFATPSEKVLARRVKTSAYAATHLEDLSVTTVFPSGLSARFRHVAVQVHNDEGTRAWRTFSIPFEPARQHVDVVAARVHRADGRVLEAVSTYDTELGEPWYRIYYDRRARVVVLPVLAAGDVVELKYRVDDITRENMFGDYFGDLEFFRRSEPVRHKAYVLIAPKGRTFHVAAPALAGLKASREERGDQQIHRFEATDIPALDEEPGMPAGTEVVPYLHVSTYASWNDVGRWWWGLVKGQLQADARIKAAVRDLLVGAKTTEDKVRRIYDWVVASTRYVGLEFGIHGYKPYRTSLVVQRGFGDCKDKASLLYVMLREAGIDARIVLLRTTRNGLIGEAPASLAIFDHAIAYVPELKLYLDGTAEHSGMRELPTMDQDAVVLVVGPDDVRFGRTPVLAAEENRRARTLTLSIEPTGAGVVEGEERVHGGEAAGARVRFEAPGTRGERLERDLQRTFPGFKLESHALAGIGDREADVVAKYRGRVPALAQRDGDRLLVDPSVWKDLVRDFARLSRRVHPLVLPATRLEEETRIVRGPKGFRAAPLAPAVTLKSPFGEFALSAKVEGAAVRVTSSFALRVTRISARDYPAFRQWLTDVDRALRHPIRFEKEAP